MKPHTTHIQVRKAAACGADTAEVMRARELRRKRAILAPSREARKSMVRTAARLPRRGLYLITPDDDDTHRLLQRVEAALGAGVVLLQYRNKTAGTTRRAEQAAALRAACALHATPLIINDDVELAAHVQADGVHLGEDDLE